LSGQRHLHELGDFQVGEQTRQKRTAPKQKNGTRIYQITKDERQSSLKEKRVGKGQTVLEGTMGSWQSLFGSKGST